MNIDRVAYLIIILFSIMLLSCENDNSIPITKTKFENLQESNQINKIIIDEYSNTCYVFTKGSEGPFYRLKFGTVESFVLSIEKNKYQIDYEAYTLKKHAKSLSNQLLVGAVLLIIIYLIILILILKSNAPAGERVLWLLVILILPILGAILFFTIGRKKLNQKKIN